MLVSIQIVLLGILVMGFLIGTLFHDTIQAVGATTANVASRVDLGDVTLGAGSWIITRVWAHAVPVTTWAAGDATAGYIQIESTSCAIAPFEFFYEPRQAGIGAGGSTSGTVEPRKYVVNCPAPGGTILNIYNVCDIAVTTPEVIVCIEYARASPFPGGQIHMTCGEPGVASSTSDGGVVSLTTIEVKAKRLLAVCGYVATTTSVADTGHQIMIEVKSDDFAEKGGPQKFILGGAQGGEATNHNVGLVQTKLVEIDASFGSPGQSQTVTAEITTYDAVTTGAMCNWCLIWV